MAGTATQPPAGPAEPPVAPEPALQGAAGARGAVGVFGPLVAAGACAGLSSALRGTAAASASKRAAASGPMRAGEVQTGARVSAGGVSVERAELGVLAAAGSSAGAAATGCGATEEPDPLAGTTGCATRPEAGARV